MARRLRKFHVIWLLLCILAISTQIPQITSSLGYRESEMLFEDVLVFVVLFSLVAAPLFFWLFIRRVKKDRKKAKERRLAKEK